MKFFVDTADVAESARLLLFEQVAVELRAAMADLLRGAPNESGAGRSVGDPKELNADVIVAAQAVQAKAVLVTDNPRHFPRRIATAHWSAIQLP